MIPRVLAMCGKGGAGKTAVTALLARVLVERSVGPILLIDADPARGLTFALGDEVGETLASVRDQLIDNARQAGEEQRQSLAERIDYYVSRALVERSNYALLAMGHSREKGCFCPANKLLREAIDVLAEPFAHVLIDAEAGVEQIHRQVTRRVGRFVVVDDGSRRSRETVRQIISMVGAGKAHVVRNRALDGPASETQIPEDPLLRRFDQQGVSLWDLPGEALALQAVRSICRRLEES